MTNTRRYRASARWERNGCEMDAAAKNGCSACAMRLPSTAMPTMVRKPDKSTFPEKICTQQRHRFSLTHSSRRNRRTTSSPYAMLWTKPSQMLSLGENARFCGSACATLPKSRTARVNRRIAKTIVLLRARAWMPNDAV